MRILIFLGLSLLAPAFATAQKVYWLLWFDTEDYLEPSSDDAALHLAQGLTQRGVKATFKLVGEKARVLESRGRRDVIEALKLHDIGYHAENHSIPPAPAAYTAPLGLLEGAAEFDRREGKGFRDLVRLFGRIPSCYGQPGNSWTPHGNLALRRWGVPVYMDDGRQIGLNQQPFWFGGLLYVFNIGGSTVRTGINEPSELAEAKAKFDAGLAALKQKGGGVMQTYYHPTEFVTTEFWDGVNFRHGANPARGDWKLPARRTKESSEQAYRLFFDFVDHVRRSGVQIVTARDLPGLAVRSGRPSRAAAKAALAAAIAPRDEFSAADMLVELLELSPRHVDGPADRGVSTLAPGAQVERWVLSKAVADVREFVELNHRLPGQAWFGSDSLSLADFAATLAADPGGTAPVKIVMGKLAIEDHVTRDAARAYNWVIHPAGFAPERLLELARLQAWTLKPVRWKP